LKGSVVALKTLEHGVKEDVLRRSDGEILPGLQMREVLNGVALKRTEENLWRVLFDDDEVQKSIAQLGDSPGVAPISAPVTPTRSPMAEQSEAQRKAPTSTAFTKTVTDKETALKVARQGCIGGGVLAAMYLTGIFFTAFAAKDPT